MIEIKVDNEEIQQCLKLLSGMPGKLNLVRKRANTEAGKILRTGLVRGINEKYYVKSSGIRKGIQIDRDAEAVKLIVRGTRKTLKSFLMRPKTAPKRRKAAGYLEGGIERGKIHKFSRGFVLPGVNLPMRRISPGRSGTLEGLHMIIGPSIAQLASREEVLPEVIERAQKRLLQQIRYWTGEMLRR